MSEKQMQSADEWAKAIAAEVKKANKENPGTKASGTFTAAEDKAKGCVQICATYNGVTVCYCV